MYRTVLTAACGTVLFALTGSAVAQLPRSGVGTPPRQYRSTTSPYLNLLDTRNGDAFNYYRRVLPEREFRRANTRIENSIRDINRQLLTPPEPPRERVGSIGTTGHPTSFRSLSTYFPSSAAGRTSGNSFGRRR